MASSILLPYRHGTNKPPVPNIFQEPREKKKTPANACTTALSYHRTQGSVLVHEQHVHADCTPARTHRTERQGSKQKHQVARQQQINMCQVGATPLSPLQTASSRQGCLPVAPSLRQCPLERTVWASNHGDIQYFQEARTLLKYPSQPTPSPASVVAAAEEAVPPPAAELEPSACGTRLFGGKWIVELDVICEVCLRRRCTAGTIKDETRARGAHEEQGQRVMMKSRGDKTRGRSGNVVCEDILRGQPKTSILFLVFQVQTVVILVGTRPYLLSARLEHAEWGALTSSPRPPSGKSKQCAFNYFKAEETSHTAKNKEERLKELRQGDRKPPLSNREHSYPRC